MTVAHDAAYTYPDPATGQAIGTRTRIFDAPSTHPEDIRFREAQVDALRDRIKTLEGECAALRNRLAFYEGSQ